MMLAQPDTGLDASAPHLVFLTSSTGDAAIDADLQYVQSLDWSKSSIGPISSWPPELLVLVNLAMLSPQPQLFLLGPDSILLYNTAYGKLLHDHHPLYQGRPISLNTALIAQTPAIERITNHAESRAKPANENYVPFFFRRNGRLEEVFISATMVKLPLSLNGFHATNYDTTTDAVQLRRAQTMDRLFDLTSSATDLPSLCSSLLAGISAADDEIAFAILYCADTEITCALDTDALHRTVDRSKFHLQGTVGSFLTPLDKNVDLTAHDTWAASLREAVASHAPVLLQVADNSLPENLRRASRERCYGDDCQEAVILSSALESDAEVNCLLVVGLAPRRPYNDAYGTWIRTLNRTIANLVASVTISEARSLAKENESRRAAKERDILAKALFLKKQEAALATGKIQRMLGIMQSANVGVFECLPTGELLQANQAFSGLSGCPQNFEEEDRLSIFSLCNPVDLVSVKERWAHLVAGESLTFTMRFGPDDQTACWVQAACTPVLNDASVVESITGCITDITAQKQAEQQAVERAETLERLRISEARLLEEAIEAKRQQENFVDMTSHEIRNPLSAVMHCTDSISQTLSDLKAFIDEASTACIDHGSTIRRMTGFHQEIFDAVETINSCTLHQARITNDILSLSKLDSDLLEICSSTFNAEKFLRDIRSAFSAEAARADITLTTVCDSSLKDLDVQWVQADPGRLRQVLVNLVANAIKFTKGQDNRRVCLSIGASTTSSIKAMQDLIIAGGSPSDRAEVMDPSEHTLYLWFKVEDTGCGMDAVGRTKMFSRFSQASPKTYSSYGGSGLGLFISHKLVSLQGGRIGFTSEAGQGSIFSFYVKALRTASSLASSIDLGLQASDSPAEGEPVKSSPDARAQLSILLVEDNLVNQKVLKKQLTRHGFLVHTAENGQLALELIMDEQHSTATSDKQSSPRINVILMDIEMPVMNGLDCAGKIRMAEREGAINRHIPIIAITANARPEQLRRAIDVGMDDAISKPFHVRDLTPIIERLGYQTHARKRRLAHP